MSTLRKLRGELRRARELKSSRGLAMFVVVVLLTLLALSAFFIAAASRDLKASSHYRRAARARLFALEGLYRAMAELYYDVWGVDEPVAFVCADADDPGTPGIREGSLADAAYYCAKAPPSAADEAGKVRAPWSRFRRSVVSRDSGGDITSPGKGVPVLTDLRWMVRQGDMFGTRICEGPGQLVPGTHCGAPYHDEFLPESTDNSDVWELGVHLNSGDVFGRRFRNDGADTGGTWSPGTWGSVDLYWPGKRPFREFDYVDTRIAGDSFYKIFRFELIDPATKMSYAAGLDPVTGLYVAPRFTHVGDATGGSYTDTRGGAVNINQVNINYESELYWGGETAETLKMHHYNESKWIYVYDAEGTQKLGRYAALVRPDCGSPNANMLYDFREIVNYGWRGTGRSSSEFLRSLDSGLTPHGGPIGGVSNIVSERVPRYESEPWYDGLGTRIGDYKNAVSGFENTGGGVISSRAELDMVIRKTCFTEAANASVSGWNHKEAALDAHIIASQVSVHGYEYLLDQHWADDRLVIDKLGLADGVLGCTYPRTRPIRSATSFFANADTRKRYCEVLDGIRFTHGPDGAREGRYTQYHDPGSEPEATRAARARAAPISWLAHAWFYVRNDFTTQGNRPYGISCESGEVSWKDKALLDDVLDDPYLAVNRTDFPLISEVGSYTFEKVSSLPKDPSGRKPWEWGAMYDPSGAGGEPDTVYFDGKTPKYFVELVKYWEMCYTHTCMYLDTKWHLYVNGNDVLNSTGRTGDAYCRTTRVIGADGTGGQGGQAYSYACEEDSTPKAVPSEEQFRNRVWAGRAMGGGCGYGSHCMALFSFNKYGDAWRESTLKNHPANYLVVTFDGEACPDPAMRGTMLGAVKPDALGGTSIVLTWNHYVIDVAHLPAVGSKADPESGLGPFRNVFECGFDAYDPVGSHSPAQWAPNSGKRERTSPAWRRTRAAGGSRPDASGLAKCPDGNGRWLAGLNYHHILSYLPGGERAPASALGYTVSDVCDRSGATSSVASGSQALACVWPGRSGTRDWEGLCRAPTGFWPEKDPVLNEDAPDPFLRRWDELMRVTHLERVLTAGYLGNYGDNIGAHGEHSIYDEVDNDMDGRIDNLTATPINGGAPGHYIADRKVMGRLNVNELQPPASVLCGGRSAASTVYVGRKPFKGYTSWTQCLTRGVYLGGHTYGEPLGEPYDMMFWYENQYADCSPDHAHAGWVPEGPDVYYKDASRILFSGNSPVYTVHVTGQALHDSQDPVAEAKLRATVERTWDGKMNVLRFLWTR